MVMAIQVHRFGGPEELCFEEIELAAPADGEAQILQRAIGVNYIDIYRRKGLYPAEPPFVPGHEGAGEIVALGKGVKDFKIGDRVAYVSAATGAYAVRRNIAADRLIHLPKWITDDVGATMMLKGLTAQYLLRRTFRVKKGHRVLVHAGAGGVGQMLCQWASALGAKVVATAGSPDKAKLAKAAGARHVILYNEEDVVEGVRRATKGKMCDVVYDGVGKATFAASLDSLRPLGMMVSFGSASGAVEPFDLALLAKKGSLFLTRPSLFDYCAKAKDYHKMTQDLIGAMKRGDLKIDVAGRYALADAMEVHRALESRATSGALILAP